MLSSRELYPQELNFYFPQRHVHHKQKLWDFYLPIMASLTLESTGRIFFSTSSIGPGLWAIFSFRSSANRALFSFIWVACSEGSAKVSKRIYWFKYSVPTFPQFHDKHHCLVFAITIPLLSKAKSSTTLKILKLISTNMIIWVDVVHPHDHVFQEIESLF